MKLKLPYIISFFLIFISIRGYSQNIFKLIDSGKEDKIKKRINSDLIFDDSLLIISEDGDSLYVNPLTYALIKEKDNIAQLIIENDENIYYYKDWVNQAFGVAVNNGKYKLVKEMIFRGADVNIYCETCNNVAPVAIAVSYNHDSIYKLLLKNGAKYVNPKSRFDVIHAAASKKDTNFLIDLVENHNCSLNELTTNKTTTLMSAMSKDNIANVKFLVRKGVNIKAKDIDGDLFINYANSLEAFKYSEKVLTKNNVDYKSNLQIQFIIETDDKKYFDYFLTNYSNQIFKLDSEGNNAYFSLLFTKENTTYFFNQLQKKGLEITNKKTLKKEAKFYKNKDLINLLK